MDKPRIISVPLAFAELLHATLGPLGDILEQEGHSWAPMVQRVLEEYTSRRNALLTVVHGDEIIDVVMQHTMTAAEDVESMAYDAVDEAILGLVGEPE